MSSRKDWWAVFLSRHPHDHLMAEEDVADTVVKRILSDAGMEAKRKHKLHVTKDRAVAVDYFIEQRRPSAIQILRAKSDISGNMEKMGLPLA
jgi:phosphopantetheine adenylyltransferase